MRASTILLSLLVALPIVSTAEDADAPRFVLRPRVHAEAVWDDNVFQQSTGERSDYSLRFRPGVRAVWNEGRIEAGLDVGLDSRVHLNESGLNETFGDARAWAELELRPGVRVRVADAYRPQPVRLGTPDDATINLVQTNTALIELRIDREIARATRAEFGLRGSRFDTEGFRADVDLDRDGVVETVPRLQTDYWEALGFVELQREVSGRTVVFGRVESRHRQHDELKTADFDEIAGLLGTRLQVGDRIELEAAAGYGRLGFDRADDESRFVGRLQAEVELPRGFTLTASARRTLASDALSTDFAETSARLGLEKMLGKRTRLSLGGRWLDFQSDAFGRRNNRAWGAELRLERQLRRRLRASLSYRHWNNGGSDARDDFEQNRVILGLDYDF